MRYFVRDQFGSRCLLLWLDFILILFSYLRMLARGLIISGRLVQVTTAPKHRSTHITNYQSKERESYERDETSLTIIPMCPQERYSHYKNLFRLALCYKKDWATLMHLIYFYCLLLVTPVQEFIRLTS